MNHPNFYLIYEQVIIYKNKGAKSITPSIIIRDPIYILILQIKILLIHSPYILL